LLSSACQHNLQNKTITGPSNAIQHAYYKVKVIAEEQLNSVKAVKEPLNKISTKLRLTKPSGGIESYKKVDKLEGNTVIEM